MRFRTLAILVVAVIWALAGQAQAGPVIADSVADFPAGANGSKQGTNGWTYGYHDFTNNGVYGPTDFIAFPDNIGPGTSPTDFWTGSSWDWHAGNPPWTVITPTGGHPNGSNNAVEQWAIRRFTSDANGAADVTFNLGKSNINGNGVGSGVYVNGVEQESMTIPGNHTANREWTIHVPTIQVGDNIDVTLNPNGHDGSDSSSFGMKVTQVQKSPTKLWADSIADFPGADNSSSDSKQGINNWSYGHHSVTTNGPYDAGDFIAFPDNQGPGTSASDFWNGSRWDWHAGNPPWTEIDAAGGHPNTGAGDEQWAIRRWTAEVDGTMFVESFLAKGNLNGGNGTALRVFHNGVEQFNRSVAFNDAIGYFDVTSIPGVAKGDFIDIALDALGADGNDGSLFSARIFAAVPEPTTLLIWSLLGGLGIGLGWRRRK